MADSDTPTTNKDGDSLWRKLLRGVESALELRVVTVVSEVEIGGEYPNAEIKFVAGKSKDAIATSINLAAGDITSVVPEQFWAPDKEVIRKFHEQQVENGHEIVRRNLELIGEVGGKLAKAIGELRATESKPG
jgi:hypothetical protein